MMHRMLEYDSQRGWVILADGLSAIYADVNGCLDPFASTDTWIRDVKSVVQVIGYLEHSIVKSPIAAGFVHWQI